VTARQIERRLGSGSWVAVHKGVYRLSGSTGSWQQRVMAAVLAANGWASHRTAGALWQLDGVRQGAIEVTITGTGGRGLRGVIVHHTRSVGVGDRAEVEEIPCTSVARTLVDLAGVLNEADLEQALDSALREGKTSVGFLARQLERLGTGRPGAAVLRDLVDGRLTERPSESRREADVARLLVEAGLPRPVRQYELRNEAGDLVARFDLAYPAARIGIEFQSYRHHFGRQAWRRDQVRANQAAAHGWLVFAVTEDEVRCRSLTTVVCAYRTRTTHKLPAA
jgi:hypothetical protein